MPISEGKHKKTKLNYLKKKKRGTLAEGTEKHHLF